MKILVICKDSPESNSASYCKILNQKNMEFIYSWKNTIKESQLKDINFVISIGGDGTALSASHFLKNTPLLAVNSSPKTSEGALTTLNLEKLEDKLKEIEKGTIRTENLERIEVLINEKPVKLLALNDVFIGSPSPYLISKYTLKINEKEELQSSSGILFSTGTGSTAWFKSAGGSPFPPTSKFIKMFVREPYFGRLWNPSLLSHQINEGEEIEITPKTPLLLAIDSIRKFTLSPKDKIKIRISSFPLKRIK